MLEADIEEGNLSDVAQAITSALRTSSVPAPTPRALPAPSAPARGRGSAPVNERGPTGTADEVHEPEAGTEEPIPDETEAVSGTPRSRGPARPYRPKVKVVDVDFDSPMTFEQFVLRAGSPKEVWKRFLVAAAWFKEHRRLDDITADHIYTCFKRMDWDVVENMTDPLWKLRQKDLGTYAKKVFTINHVGLDKVAKMARENPAA